MTPETFHIRIEEDTLEGRRVFVAIVDELPGITAFGESDKAAVEEVIALLEDYRRRRGADRTLSVRAGISSTWQGGRTFASVGSPAEPDSSLTGAA